MQTKVIYVTQANEQDCPHKHRSEYEARYCATIRKQVGERDVRIVRISQSTK